MNMFIFVSVMCIGQQCDFMTSQKAVTEAQCQQIKKQFFALPFKPEVTLAAAQCMQFDNNKVQV